MDLSVLNKEQKEAVLYNDGPLLIIAGAGSGKTKAITYKVAYLIDSGVKPEDIIAITFTNKAADEMRDRVYGLIGNDTKVFISTFHKFCGRILRAYIDTIGYSRDFSIYDSDDSLSLMNKVVKDFGYDDKKVNPKACMKRLSSIKNQGISIDAYEKDAKSEHGKDFARCFREYEKRMFKNNAVDFDDMLLLTVRVLKENEVVRKKLSSKYKYILVDEYQDTNLIQFELIKLLVKGTDNKLTVVGDDDQSIYKFRGADIKNILEFEDAFKGSKVIKLTQNYRSTNNILKVANTVIKNNIGRKGKELWSKNGDGEKVIYTEYEDDSKEAYSVINKIKRNRHYKDTAVLYRTNAQSRKFEEMCMSLNIPYKLIGGISFYQRREIKDILAYLHILINERDSESLQRIINVPKRGIGDTSLEKIVAFASEKDISVLEALKKIDDIAITKKAKDGVKSFIELYDKLKNEPEIDLIIGMILDNGYEDYLIDEYGRDEARERKENIEELMNKAVAFKKAYPDLVLNDFLYEIALVSSVDELDDTDDKLTLMTLHASKGLEYDTVYLVGLNDGVFPTFMSKEENNLEEERRLCYVGITRAKTNLYISSSKLILKYGKVQHCMPSEFIDEMDTDAIEKTFVKNKDTFDYDFKSEVFTKTKFSEYKNPYLK